MPGARGLFTGRIGGASGPPYGAAEGVSDGMNLGDHVGDDPAAVAANRRALAMRCGGVRIAWMTQVHGVEVADLDAWDGSAVPEADAAVCGVPGIAACVMVADCLPVLFAAPGAVGAAHAGWRGLAAGVLERTLGAVCRKASCAPGQVRAWLGPAIGPRCFEVGGEVREAFIVSDTQAACDFLQVSDGKWHADLFALARRRLVRAGMTATDIHGGDICTMSNPALYYSFRRQRVTGRQAGLVWIPGG